MLYTNQAGTSGRSTVFPANAAARSGRNTDASNNNNNLFITFAGNDFGVQAVASIQFSAGSVGSHPMDLFLFYPLTFLATTSGGDDYWEQDLLTAPGRVVPLEISSGQFGCLDVVTCTGPINATSNALFLSLRYGQF